MDKQKLTECTFNMHYTTALTQDTKYKMKFILHCRPREEGASGDHFIEYTTYTPMLMKQSRQTDRQHKSLFEKYMKGKICYTGQIESPK